MNNKSDVTTNRDGQIICGLFLSKFDQAGLEYLGFDSFAEAYNTLGYSLRARPASIKNYRDELDPYFPNVRKGWHKRPLREHCERIADLYKDASLSQLGEIIKAFICPSSELENIPEVRRVLNTRAEDGTSSFAKRLITGRAAEEYFAVNYRKMPEFSDLLLTDTTRWGCGFDFKLSAIASDSYCAVEVKGLRMKFGQIQFTALEYEMADALAGKYYLVLVRNFAEQPFHSIVKDPAHCDLVFKRVARKETRFSWIANVEHQ
jgi:uncharacterized protein DUF3883